jgi:hypothetical protein
MNVITPNFEQWKPQAPQYAPKERKQREVVSGLSFFPRLNLWKASNVALDAKTLTSWSYGWWEMSKKIGPYLVFNSYGYSNSTRKHQCKVRGWLYDQNESFVTIESPGGLQDLNSARRHYNNLIETLHKEIDNPRSKAMKNHERFLKIAEYQSKLRLVDILERIQGGAA